MTVSSTENRISYSANGATTSFSFPYYFLEDADLVVSAIDSSGDVIEYVLDTDYTISGTAASNGTYPDGASIVFDTAPATGLSVCIVRSPADTQETNWVDGDPDPALVKETAFDKLTLLVQRSWDLLSRSVVLPDAYVGSFSNQLPPTLTPNYGLVVNEDGDGWTLAAVSANSGTVTSVGLTTPSEFVAGGNVTTSGNLSFTKSNQSANTVWAGPNSGSSAAPAFRALVAADLPQLALTSLSSGSATSGQVPVADGSSGISWESVEGTGTVTSVGLSMPAQFSVSDSPVTTNGTLTVGWANQSANLVMAGPTAGGSATPDFRSLVAADLPALGGATVDDDGSAGVPPPPTAGQQGLFLRGDATWAATPQGTVTSIGLSVPSELTLSDSPVTGSGTITIGKANQTANTIWAGPDTGSAAAPAFRSLVPADLPLMTGATSLAAGIAGAVPAPNSGQEAYFLRGDATWSTVGAGTGTVQSVGLSMPADFTVSDSPVTGIGTLTAAWATENPNVILAGPASGATAETPTWRSLVVADLPSGYLATNLDSGSATDGQVLTANGLGACTWTTLSTGGTVTSIGMTVPSSLLSVSGSPITNSGTLGMTLVNQNANTVFSGPSSGSSAAPNFRALVAADIPQLTLTSLSSGSATANQVPLADGSGGITWGDVPGVGSATTITTDTNASTSYSTYFCSGTLTLTLAAPDGNKWTVKNVGSGAVTVGTASGDIENQSTATLNPGDVFTFEDDGSNYWQVG